MKTTLIHSGSSSSLASLAPGVVAEEISTHPGSAEFIFNPPEKSKKRDDEVDKPTDGKGWFAHKFRFVI